jgi:hypothetical protein
LIAITREINWNWENENILELGGSFHGASSQSNYKEKSKLNSEDWSVFIGSLIPMKLNNGDRVLCILFGANVYVVIL